MKKSVKKPKVIIVTGSTATGKSSVGIFLAKKFNGEIISADSRQIYKGLENFSGTDRLDSSGKIKGIKHHLLSFINPGELFTASDFKEKTEKLIDIILKRGKTPIIVGGTAFYIKSILYKNFIPKVEPNPDFRKNLDQFSTEELATMLKEKSPQRHSEIDLKNRRRVVRSLEIINKLGYFPKMEKELNEKYNFKLIELYADKKHIEDRIEKNFDSRLDGMIKEAADINNSISKNVFSELGLAYKNIEDFWKNIIDKGEFRDLGVKEEQKYAKRQKTFLKKLHEEFPSSKKRFDISGRFLYLKTYIFIKFDI